MKNGCGALLALYLIMTAIILSILHIMGVDITVGTVGLTLVIESGIILVIGLISAFNEEKDRETIVDMEQSPEERKEAVLIEKEYIADSPSNIYFNQCKRVSKLITRQVGRITNDKELFGVIRNITGIEIWDRDDFVRCNPRVAMIIFHDLWKCYTGMGFKIDEDGYSNLCFTLALCRMLDDYDIEILQFNMSLLHNSQSVAFSVMRLMEGMEIQGYEAQDAFLMPTVYAAINRDVSDYMKLLIDVSECMASSKGEPSAQAEAYIEKYLRAKIKSSSKVESIGSRENKEKTEKRYRKSNDEPRDEGSRNPDDVLDLDSLIGLNEVKSEVKKLRSYVQVLQWREREGLKSPTVSYHCVFTGNPGTGKTTVARIIADIYKELGILKKGHLIETDRSGLIAEYVGQTAVKTNKKIDEALDGVLFIDEAYSLVTGDSSDYGLEAISTLLKRMEDERNRLVVILAGYGDKMRDFIGANPGLQSRFNRFFHFEDYSAEELMKIFLQILEKHEYVLESEEVRAKVQNIIKEESAKGDATFGNARYVRNLFERILENQALRLAAGRKTDRQSLQTITLEDIE